jgi:hypothetical protein
MLGQNGRHRERSSRRRTRHLPSTSSRARAGTSTTRRGRTTGGNGSHEAYELGTLEDSQIRLRIADAAECPGGLLFTAVAARGVDSYRDYRLEGSALGILDREGRGRWVPLIDHDEPITLQGIATDAVDPRLVTVVDVSDHVLRPAALRYLRLDGPWW